MIEINPQILIGSWKKGYALDLHTISSSHNQDGKFENTRSKIGEMIYDIKYNLNREKIGEISEILSNFIRGKYSGDYVFPFLNGIICVPPSNEDRPFQPVIEIGKEIGKNLNISVLDNLKKVRKTPILKNMTEIESQEVLKDVFEITNSQILKGKNILIFDDLYGTGNTLNEITKTLLKNDILNIYVLTITKTRTKTGMRQNNYIEHF